MVDANVWISAAILPGGAVRERLTSWCDQARVFVSPRLIEEVERTLGLAKMTRFGPSGELVERARRLLSGTESFDPPPLPAPVCRDPDDDHVLALALHANAGWIVTGDRDLLVLDPWEGIRIVTPGDVE